MKPELSFILIFFAKLCFILQELVVEGIVVLSDKKGSKVPVISETKKVVVKQVLDPRSGDWLEPDLAHRRGLLDTEKGTYR